MKEPKFEPMPRHLLHEVLDAFRLSHGIAPLLKEHAPNRAKNPVKAKVRRVKR